MKNRKLAIITTHPIQYNAPLFKLLSESKSFDIKVFYTWSQAQNEVFDKDFGISRSWDIPLLEGYDFTFVKNISPDPGSHYFKGIINPSLNKEIEEWKADALLVYGWAFSSHLKAIRYFSKKIPVFFRGDSTLIDEPAGFSFKKAMRRIFLKWVYSHVSYALFVGSANKKYYAVHGLKPAQLVFAPHAVDNSRFLADQNEYIQKAKRWREQLNISEKNIVFLFAAKLIKKKDPELLIKAFLSLNNSQTNLIIVGNGELEKELKEKYKSYKDINFIDFQNQGQMPVVYRMCDVFVLPSKGPGETWGLAINEAMACGRAVIASDKCGCSEDIILPGKNGSVFEAGDVESLTNSMRSAFENYEKQGDYSKQIIKDWSYEKTVDQLRILLEKQVLNAEG